MEESMLEKLTKMYHIYNKIGAEGYVIGFYKEKDEIINGQYKFEKGTYTIESVNKDFFFWHYQSDYLSKMLAEREKP